MDSKSSSRKGVGVRFPPLVLLAPECHPIAICGRPETACLIACAEASRKAFGKKIWCACGMRLNPVNKQANGIASRRSDGFGCCD